MRVAHEVFAERRYEADGMLTPRSHADAVIEDIDAALAQVRRFVREGAVVARPANALPLRADTLCLHGDRARRGGASRKRSARRLLADGVAHPSHRGHSA